MDPIWSGNTLRSNTSCNFSPFFVFCLLSLCVCLFIVNMCMWKVGRQSFAIQYTQVSCNRLLGIPPTPECLWTTTTTTSPRQVTTTTSSPRQVDDGGFKHASLKRWSLFRSRRWRPRCSMRPSRLFWPGNVRHRCWHPPLSPSVLRFDAGILMF